MLIDLQTTRNKIQLSTSSQKCLTLQTPDDTEFYDWLYAISPLLVGQLRYACTYQHGPFHSFISSLSFADVVKQ